MSASLPDPNRFPEYEEAFLAAVMLDPKTLDLPGIDCEDFNERIVYDALGAALSLHARGLVPDLPTLASLMPVHAVPLASISSKSPSAANATYYLEKISEAARRRRLEPMLQDALEALKAGQPLGPEIVAKLERTLSTDTQRGRPGGGFQLRRAGEMEIKPPQWLVRGLLEADSLGLAYGDPAAGKSFFALDLAASIATGTAFHGRKIARPGPVVYIAGEGHSGLSRRLRAWEIAGRVSLKDAPLYVSTLPASLCDPGTMGEVGRVVAQAAKDAGPPRLIVLDTWSRNLGGDENSSDDTALAIAALDRLRAPYQSAVLAVHHTGHAEKGRARGSTVLRGAVDLELQVARGEDAIIRVTCTKAKDIAPPAPMAFSLRDVDLGILDEEGRPVISAVLEEEECQPEAAPKPLTGKNQKKAMDALRNVEASGRNGDEASVTVVAWQEACAQAGIKPNRFNEVRDSLLKAKAIHIQGLFVSEGPSEPSVRPNPRAYISPSENSDIQTRTTSENSDEIRTDFGQNSDNGNSSRLATSSQGNSPPSLPGPSWPAVPSSPDTAPRPEGGTLWV